MAESLTILELQRANQELRDRVTDLETRVVQINENLQTFAAAVVKDFETTSNKFEDMEARSDHQAKISLMFNERLEELAEHFSGFLENFDDLLEKN